MRLSGRLLPPLLCTLGLLAVGCGLSEPTSGAPEYVPPPDELSAKALYPITSGNRWIWDVVGYGDLPIEFRRTETIGYPDSSYGRLGYLAQRLVIMDGDTTRNDTVHYTFLGDTLIEALNQPIGWFRVMMGVKALSVGDTLKLNGVRGAYAQFLGDHHAITTSDTTFVGCVLLRYHDFLHFQESDYYFKSGVGIVRIDERLYDISYGPRDPVRTRIHTLVEYHVAGTFDLTP